MDDEGIVLHYNDRGASEPLLMCLIVDKDVGVNDNDNEYQQ